MATTTFQAASQSFGAPRGGAGLLKTVSRLWHTLSASVSARTNETMTPGELMQLADQHESTSPSLAADLRAAALLAQRTPGV